MRSVTVSGKPFIVGVMGSHRDIPDAMADARRLGEAIAARGWVLLTGGGPGLMKAASEGAWQAGGLVIGILPNERADPPSGYPNEFVHIPVFTGMRDARNIINVKTAHVVIALSGGPGTLSEIALALRAGTPVVGLHAPAFHVEGMAALFHTASSVEEAIAKVEGLLGQAQAVIHG
jgi:uncharacterized protein (TIGR00725 family)